MAYTEYTAIRASHPQKILVCFVHVNYALLSQNYVSLNYTLDTGNAKHCEDIFICSSLLY